MKANKEISHERVVEVSECLLDGLSTYAIVQKYTEIWNLKRRQIETYVRKARDLHGEIFEREIKNNLNWHLITRRKLYERAIKEKNYNEARNVLKDLAELQGLYKIRIESESKETHEHVYVFESAFDKMEKESQEAILDLLESVNNGNGNGSNKKVFTKRQ